MSRLGYFMGVVTAVVTVGVALAHSVAASVSASTASAWDNRCRVSASRARVLAADCSLSSSSLRDTSPRSYRSRRLAAVSSARVAAPSWSWSKRSRLAPRSAQMILNCGIPA